ncbi:uncharacterized protein LOC118319774 isoform X3 [Scophthalmus maximus]|uniref:uncharacterized protein LOC118319774 isoform X3 n=1 Tax=Scophthalmus maximus TaxID=52904 RepID=UPI001FA8FEE6|nr:uncharacterized protein LOC118319774 isoform X3 [Scophthalmus maximus]
MGGAGKRKTERERQRQGQRKRDRRKYSKSFHSYYSYHRGHSISTQKVEYLRKVGNEKEVAIRRNTNQDLISSLEECAGGVSYNQWRDKFSSDLVKMVDDRKKPYAESILGLLRFIRNLLEHYPKEAAKVDLMSLFPHLFGCVYKFSKSQGWNLESPLREMFTAEATIGPTRDVLSPTNYEDQVNLAVQESQPTTIATRSISGDRTYI